MINKDISLQPLKSASCPGTIKYMPTNQHLLLSPGNSLFFSNQPTNHPDNPNGYLFVSNQSTFVCNRLTTWALSHLSLLLASGTPVTPAGARFNIHMWNTEPIINFPTPTNGIGKPGQLIMIPPSNTHLEENN